MIKTSWVQLQDPGPDVELRDLAHKPVAASGATEMPGQEIKEPLKYSQKKTH